MTFLLAIFAKYKFYIISFFAGVLILGAFILWHNHAINQLVEDTRTTTKTETDAWWIKHIAESPTVHNETTTTTSTPQPRQSATVKDGSRPRTPEEEAYADSLYNEGWNGGYEKARASFRFYTQRWTPVKAFPSGDTVLVDYDPLTHVGTIDLIRPPLKEITHTISDSKMVSIPCPPVPFYDTRTAWYSYGAATVIVIYEGYRLATK